MQQGALWTSPFGFGVVFSLCGARRRTRIAASILFWHGRYAGFTWGVGLPSTGEELPTPRARWNMIWLIASDGSLAASGQSCG